MGGWGKFEMRRRKSNYLKMFVAIVLGSAAIILTENTSRRFGWSILELAEIIFGLLTIPVTVWLIATLTEKYIKNSFLRWGLAIALVGFSVLFSVHYDVTYR